MGNPADLTYYENGFTMKELQLFALDGLYSAISHFTSQSLSIIFSDPSHSLVKELLFMTGQIS